MLNSAPRKAARGTQEISPRSPPAMGSSQCGNKIRPRIPPKEAPPETPIICGQASGLRSSACSTTPQAAMPPPMATPKRTRGSRARNSISASGFAENTFCKACDRSSRTGPSRVQPTMDSTSRANRSPLTQIIFLRSRTFTAISSLESGFGFREALGMHHAGDFLQSLANPRSGPKNFVRWIRIDAPLFYSGNRLEISPMLCGCCALQSHARLDDDLRRFRHHVFVGQIEPGLRRVAGNIITARQSNELVDKVLAAYCNQGAKANNQKSGAARCRRHSFFHLVKFPFDFQHQFFRCSELPIKRGTDFIPAKISLRLATEIKFTLRPRRSISLAFAGSVAVLT